MMTCRFLIHLREWESATTGGNTTFSVGDPIRFDHDEDDNNASAISWSAEIRRDPLLQTGEEAINQISEGSSIQTSRV